MVSCFFSFLSTFFLHRSYFYNGIYSLLTPENRLHNNILFGEQFVLLLGALEPVKEGVPELGQRPEGELGVDHEGVTWDSGGDVFLILIQTHDDVKSNWTNLLRSHI